VFAILYRQVDTKLPGDTSSYLSRMETECCLTYQWCNWWSWDTDGLEGIKLKAFEGTLGG